MPASRPTRFSSDKDAGFALAAVLADDRELTQVRGCLTPDDLTRIRCLATSSQPDKSVLIAQLLAALHPRLTELPPTLPARLRALLAPQLPRAAAQKVLADAPLARAGFEPERELIARLLRIARFSHAEAERQRPGEHADVTS